MASGSGVSCGSFATWWPSRRSWESFHRPSARSHETGLSETEHDQAVPATQRLNLCGGASACAATATVKFEDQWVQSSSPEQIWSDVLRTPCCASLQVKDRSVSRPMTLVTLLQGTQAQCMDASTAVRCRPFGCSTYRMRLDSKNWSSMANILF